ncbi:homeobox protein NANOG isoform X1 [Xiphias gladius]|uniref:homeobox protein NANOG isoform X1 n=1 Tax=Xiphias gladius TaxID=8245 RepID=UPI001A98C5A2|nr:homeobox protein NANOG isoform X1 [Xiphias gladius]
MADWKAQISYNYNPSYHAYSYGLVYQPGPELNHGNLTCWGEAGVTDTSNYNTGVTQAFYATTARTHEESPPGTPEQHAVNGHHHHYQGSGVVYLGDTQAGCLLLARPHRTANGVRRAGSDSTSDSEAHTPPDSWSSSCSREGSLHQADPASWEKKNLNKAGSRNPVASKDVSSSLMEEPQTFAVIGNGSTNNITSLHVPINAPNKPSTTAVNNPKGKVRAAFSESQMNALVQRFSVQRYLTPAEMKNLAELTGLTYKQVKTWFQNRRMKLRRHQKDTSWVSERYTINKDSPVHGTVYTNIPSHIPSYKGEAQSQLKEHYNQHTMEAAFKKTAPKNLAFYLAAMGSAAGSAGYPSWSSTSSQSIVPNRPQATGWSMPPGFSYYEYNPSAFTSSTANNTGHDISLEIKDDEPANNRSSLYTAIGHNANQ